MAEPDHEDFLRLLTAAQPDLRAFVAACVREPAGRDDVVQEVTLVLWRRFADYDRSRPFGAWARGVACLVLKAWWRRTRQHQALEPAAIEALTAAWEDPDGSHEEELEALRRCLDEIDGRQRRWLELRYAEGLNCAAVAKRLGGSATAVQRALHRLRERLADCLRRRLAQVGGA